MEISCNKYELNEFTTISVIFTIKYTKYVQIKSVQLRQSSTRRFCFVCNGNAIYIHTKIYQASSFCMLAKHRSQLKIFQFTCYYTNNTLLAIGARNYIEHYHIHQRENPPRYRTKKNLTHLIAQNETLIRITTKYTCNLVDG